MPQMRPYLKHVPLKGTSHLNGPLKFLYMKSDPFCFHHKNQAPSTSTTMSHVGQKKNGNSIERPVMQGYHHVTPDASARPIFSFFPSSLQSDRGPEFASESEATSRATGDGAKVVWQWRAAVREPPLRLTAD
jgi:hypothetical protein